jgi:hypothetical protein
MSDQGSVEFCPQYPDHAIEASAEGDILTMPPSDFLTWAQIGKIPVQLSLWSQAGRGGWLTESSGGFDLPNGARRAPDVAWFPIDKVGARDLRKRATFPSFRSRFCDRIAIPG